MSLRKQIIRETSNDLTDDITQETESVEEEDEKVQLSVSLLSPPSSRARRRREQEDPKKEMTEEEMMDLALRLSEQEASDTALRRRQEEEAVLKAIQESMEGHSSSHSLLRLCSRKKLLRSNCRMAAAATVSVVQETSEVALEIDLTQDTNSAAEETCQKRKDGSSPLLHPSHEPQPIRGQSPDSAQSSASSDEAPPPKSPVFPPSGCRAVVRVPRLSQDLLETYRGSGFVLCSQEDTPPSPPKAPPTPPRSPTFPGSPIAKLPPPPRSLLFSESEDETQLSQHFLKSPVFQTSCSQESFTSCVRTTSCVSPTYCPPHSPVFPGSPVHLRNGPPTESIITHRGATERGQGEELSQAEVKRSKRRRNTGSASLPSDQSEKPMEISQDLNPEEAALSSNMKLLWSEDEDETPAGSLSPVFPEEQEAPPPLNYISSPAGSSSTEEELQPISSEGRVSRVLAPPTTVHYYWGVPFCPRGLDPDHYTQVILTQLDVYGKSLKQAQRRLLRKAPWGDAILPQPEKPPEEPRPLVRSRRGLRLRRKTLSEEEEEDEEQEKDEEDKEEEEEEGEKGMSEGEGQMEAEECAVCPETQLSDKTQMMIHTSPVGPESPAIPQEDTCPPDHHSEVQEEEEEQMDVNVCRTTKTNASDGAEESPGQDTKEKMDPDPDPGVDPDLDPGPDPGVQELTGKGLKRSASPDPDPDPDPDLDPPSPAAVVDCPICLVSFPASRIEHHAAFCDGEVTLVEEVEPAAPTPHRKRRRAGAPKVAETDSRNLEKCFICQRKVDRTQFSQHTELCLAQGLPTRTLTRGNLLSALDQTELRGAEAGPSGSRLQSGEVIDLRDDDDDDGDEEGGAPSFRISHSPTRSFTSEAAGCPNHLRGQQKARRSRHRQI